MPETDSIPAREQLIELIGNASLSGYLGLFVGTGFSKAATNDGAPSFDDLIRRLIQRLGLPIDIDDDAYRHRSLPQIASKLVEELTYQAPGSPASERLKEEVAHLCNVTPEPSLGSSLSTARQIDQRSTQPAPCGSSRQGSHLPPARTSAEPRNH